MFADFAYRLVLLIVLGAGLVVSKALRNRADESGGPVSRSLDGRWMAWALRFTGAVFYGSLFLWLLYPLLVSWAGVAVAEPWRWFGAVLLTGGVCLGLWSLWHLGRNVTPTAVAREDADLVRSGPYRWVRHPLYSSSLLTIPGCGLLSANLLVFFGGVATFGVILWRTRREEQELIARFGDQYIEYRRRTGRILPRFR